jgi:hypothetical protein
VSTEAIKSRPECAASERIPKLPVEIPTAIFKPVITMAARTEFPAAARFSARINSADGIAGLLDMLELSLVGLRSRKQIHRKWIVKAKTGIVDYRLLLCDLKMPA